MLKSKVGLDWMGLDGPLNISLLRAPLCAANNNNNNTIYHKFSEQTNSF